jgi:calcineurin-like phosphoesterase family protein
MATNIAATVRTGVMGGITHGIAIGVTSAICLRDTEAEPYACVAGLGEKTKAMYTSIISGSIPSLSFVPDQVAFTSDLHLGHDKPFIYEPRGFDNVLDHDQAIMKSLMLLECELLFIVGDVMMGPDKVDRITRLFNMLPYEVSLILGNHDPSAKALHEFQPVSSVNIRLDDEPVTLSHFPADFEDHRGRDFSDFLPPDDGGVLIHGHTHRNNKVTISRHGTRQLHVGWDAWSRPVFGDELLAMLPFVG